MNFEKLDVLASSGTLGLIKDANGIFPICESTPFVSSIRPSVPLDVIISSFSKFNGRTIPRKKLPGKGRIVFDLSTPPSFGRNPNLGTRFF